MVGGVLSDSRTLLTGGADRTIRRWDAVSGEPIGGVVVGAPDDPLAAYANDPGAQVFRACVACHTLSPGRAKAGPSLAGIFGRKIATLPGYRYSEALKHMNIVWTPQTVAKMFEVGPMTYTPGTKMPEQKIGSARTARRWWNFWRRRRRRSMLSFRGAGASPRTRNPETRSIVASGFRVRR